MGIRRILVAWGVLICLVRIAEGDGGDLQQQLSDVDLGRVVKRLEDEKSRAGVSWVVQLSDLHVSKFHPERVEALRKLMGTILATIQPSLVLITGDLTDAKSKTGTSTQQYEEEWIAYRDSIDLMIKESGLNLEQFYDLRGNHDKYGVPLAKSSLDFYSQYSCNARMKRTSLVQSVTLIGHDGWKHLFVGVDDSMSVGLRGPSNLFGHPSDNTIAKLERELSQWDDDTTTPVTKVVFGHFPTSFTASSESGHRSDQIMAKHNVSAYINGHLHCKFGRHLYKHHMNGMKGEFWEWEMGDWRTSRMMRILAFDHDRVSFVDLDLGDYSKKVLRGERFQMPTVILPTSPLDSRYMLRSSSSPFQADGGPVRALVFSPSPPSSVTVRVFDSAAKSVSNFVDYSLVESLKMVRISGPSAEEDGGPFVYEAAWESQKYLDSSPTRFWLQIQVLDSDKNSTTSDMWPFSIQGKMAPFKLTWLGFLVMGFQWESFYPVVLWIMVCVVLGCLLLIPQLAYIYLEKQGKYDRWALSIFNPSATSSFPYIKLPVWALLEGARNRPLWLAQVGYIAFLLVFPWFWGRVLAEDYPVGYMTLWGWTVWPSKSTVFHQSGVGWPDIMGIVLPYISCVLFPFVLMVSALCAEQGACELVLAVSDGDKLLGKDDVRTDTGMGVGENVSRHATKAALAANEKDDEKPLLSEKEDTGSPSARHGSDISSEEDEEEVATDKRESKVFSRRVRKIYFVGCFAIALLHLRLCLFMASSYGAQAIFLSPFYVWPVPILIVLSIYMTSAIKPRNLVVNQI
ncbi:hypothetical protein MPTK1_5g10440 [Marchantia polymorpha subsp. ruderalis]|uniref:Calcineurin-like phosphoesterase domain-containing protein n=2 Tax=Marchantia polymorpha TaxID=3197 RepID=A0AAF6BGY2_MARPO|nr:hypothetical protein MARPO_0048s0028 [Marchantia polymorpha]BBN11266.1 hypothetical protein Mp_5g10440 [Marchantia polymorpha subsp. ruderalis]|eukprot:PTQ38904.1 hypothetical protein MARPO_0048s0028 [Marchantia polymorpha]